MNVGESLGHYKITREIGVGGMGEVYAAEDTRLGRQVALKILPQELAADPKRLQRFEREARAIAALDHPNIVTVHSFEESDGIHFITMQLVAGLPLSEVIGARGLPLERFFELAIPITEAVAAAHQRGITHRDLKPSNIMVTDEGRPLILDFGLAKLLEEDEADVTGTRSETALLTAEGKVMGTAAYMSPEQAEGKQVDHRSDIFSLGIILYEMATGSRPFTGETRLSLLSSIVNDVPVSISDLQPDAPRHLARIVSLTLEKDPLRRFQSAMDMRNELDELRKEVESGAVRPFRRSVSRRLKPRWLVPALAIAVVGLIALAVALSGYVSGAAVPFEERDWIIITDFENLTGEEVFDDSLRAALTVSVDQSRYVNVLPGQRIRSALARMERPEIETINEEIGREIAEREGIGVLLLPSISKVADDYMLSAVLQDARTGESLRSEIVRAEGQDGILDALDALTRRIRRDLGETAASIEQQSKSLAEVTTDSLEALKQYSVGSDMLKASRFDDAKSFYELALRIDPDFTAAKASLGMLHVDRVRVGTPGFDAEEGRRLLEEAIRQVDGLTEKERYGILAFHAWAVDGDVDAAENHYKAGLALYPDNSAAHNNLGWLYQNTGRFDEAIAAYQEAVRIDPHLMLTWDGMAYVYSNHLGDLDSAIEVAERQLGMDQEHARAYDTLGWAYLGKSEYEQARDALERAVALNPRAALDWYRLAHANRLLGDYEAALEALEGVARAAPEDQWVHYHRGVVYGLAGDEQRARGEFEQFRPVPESWVQEYPDNVVSHQAMGLTLARLGEHEAARAALATALEVAPTAHFELAQLCAVLGLKADALDHLESAIDAGFSNFVWIRIHPDFIDLYDEPRFQQLWRAGLS